VYLVFCFKRQKVSKNRKKDRDRDALVFDQNVRQLLSLRRHLPDAVERLFLWGPMGSGKSTLGPLLAEHLNLPFVDLDEFIVTRQGKSIARYFEEEGEAAFRQMEARALRFLLRDKPRLVLATGGGTPCFFQQDVLMLRSGFCVYLKASPAVLAHRLFSEISKRPLLKPWKTRDELSSFFERHLAEREPHYMRAHLVFPVI